MRKIFLVLVITSYISTLSGQDSTKTIAAIDTGYSMPIGKTIQRLEFNYTSFSINNIFNTDFRAKAHDRITVDFDYAGNSNTVPASFVYALLFRHDISTKLKDRIDRRIKTQLRFEDNMKTGITYARYLKKWDGMFYVSYNHRQMRNVLAPKDAFETIFYGNARFENDTADFSNLRVQNFIYNQYSIGLKKKIDYGKYQMVVGASLSFLQVFNNQDIHTGNTKLYTAPDGEYLDVTYNLTFNGSNEGASKFFALNGVGASGDLNIAFMNSDKWKLSLDLSDFGATFQHIGILSLEFHVDKLSRPLL